MQYNINKKGSDIMATTPTQIRIDSDVKKESVKLFSNLGLDMSSAVNMFLHQCILRGGLPFSVEVPNFSKQTLKAMEEAKSISKDSSVKGCKSMKELKEALEK